MAAGRMAEVKTRSSELTSLKFHLLWHTAFSEVKPAKAPKTRWLMGTSVYMSEPVGDVYIQAALANPRETGQSFVFSDLIPWAPDCSCGND